MPGFEVTVEARFSASHRVRLPNGELEPPHGHDWHARAGFFGAELDASGMLIDFVSAQQRLAEVVAQLHHTDLNACPAMKGMNPTAEHVARVIFEQLACDSELATTLHSVTVTEAPGCRARYQR